MSSAPRKTPEGMAELEARAHGLSPLARRLLIFVDGQRTAADLQQLMGKTEVGPLLESLIACGCVVWPGGVPAAGAGATAAAGAVAASAEPVWPIEPRTPKQIEMAKNFMINTLITFVGQYANPDLMKKVQAATDSSVLRDSLQDWKRCIETSTAGARRLKELEAELRKVL
jgi:hypothetical protein